MSRSGGGDRVSSNIKCRHGLAYDFEISRMNLASRVSNKRSNKTVVLKGSAGQKAFRSDTGKVNNKLVALHQKKSLNKEN